MRRVVASVGLAIFATIPPLAAFTRFNGPTTLRATRAAPRDPFDLEVTFRRGPFTKVDAFSSSNSPRAVFKQLDYGRKDDPNGFVKVSIEEHPIFGQTFDEVGRPEDLLAPAEKFGDAYADAFDNGALSFGWDFPGDRGWSICLGLTLAAPLLGAVAGFWFSGRRRT